MDAKHSEQIQAFITGAGFSVFVALWFMLKHDKTLNQLTRAIEKLTDMLNARDK